MDGWIRFYRCLLDKAVWKCSTPEQKCVLITILLLANHEPNQWIWGGEKFQLQEGQFITSLKSLAEKAGVSQQNVRSALRKLENAEFLTNKSTKTGRLITIVNWGVYQPPKEEPNKQPTKSQQTGNKQVTTNKNDKNVINKDIYIAHFEEAWKIYPKKKDKSRAFQCYMARINSGYSEDELLTATKNYAAECEKDGRPEKYIKNGSTFFGINEPFVDYLGERKSTPVNGPMEYEIDNGDTHPQIPPYYGFPKEWFDGDEPVRDRFVKIKQKQNFSIGVTDDTIYSPDELWDKYILRKRGYEYEQQLRFDDRP